jgi:hypothetical protein
MNSPGHPRGTPRCSALYSAPPCSASSISAASRRRACRAPCPPYRCILAFFRRFSLFATSWTPPSSRKASSPSGTSRISCSPSQLLRVDDGTLKKLRGWVSHLLPEQTDLTAKNRVRLRQFDDQENVRSLSNLPSRVGAPSRCRDRSKDRGTACRDHRWSSAHGARPRSHNMRTKGDTSSRSAGSPNKSIVTRCGQAIRL